MNKSLTFIFAFMLCVSFASALTNVTNGTWTENLSNGETINVNENANLTFVSNETSTNWFDWFVNGVSKLAGIGQNVFNWVFNNKASDTDSSVTMKLSGGLTQLTSLNDSSTSKNLTFTGGDTQNVYLSIPKTGSSVNSNITLTGYPVSSLEIFVGSGDITYTNISSNGLSSMDSDGTYIWGINSRAGAGLRKEYANGTYIGSYPIRFTTSSFSLRLAVDGTNVWVFNTATTNASEKYLVYKFDYNGNYVSSLNLSSSLSATGVRSFFINNGELIVYDGGTTPKTYVRFSKAGSYLGSVNTTAVYTTTTKFSATNNTYFYSILNSAPYTLKKYYSNNYTEIWSYDISSTSTDVIRINNNLYLNSGTTPIVLKKAYLDPTTVNVYPTNAYLEVGTSDGTREWNYTGSYIGTNITNDFSSPINSYLTTCTAVNGYCSVPLALYSSSVGILQISNILSTYRNTTVTLQEDYVVNTSSANPIMNITYPYNLVNIEGTQSYVNTTLNWTISDTTSTSCWYNLNGTNISISNCSTNFVNLNYLAKGYYNLILYANDSVGNFGSSTINMSINNQAPTLTLNYPTSLINYGSVNGTLQLNFTATDSNLDKVWYNYNGTNVSIASALTGIANLSNITLSTKKNVTIYANDTAGNLNTTTFSWDYRVFENSRTFVNSTYAKVSNNFLVNITSTNISSIILNYNGTNYTTSSYASGSNTIGTIDILSPTVTANTNYTFYYLFVLTDGTVVTSPSNIQAVNYITIGNTYSNLVYNISVRNESSNALLNNSLITMSYVVDYSHPSGSLLGTTSFNDNGLVNKNISSNINTSLFMEGNILYAGTGLIGRNYYFLESNISSPKNVTLYSIGSLEGYVKTIKVTDEAGRPLPATYKMYRSIAGVNTLVSSEVLDSSGTSTLAFIPNIQYNFEFSSSGCTNLTKHLIFYDQTDYQQSLVCTSYNPDNYDDEFEGMNVSFSPNGIFTVDNATSDDDSLFSSTVSGTSSFCSKINVLSFSVYDDTNTLISNTNRNSCGTLTGTGYFNYFSKGSMYILLDDGSEKTIDYRWQKVYVTSDYTNYSMINLIGQVGNSDDILGIDWKFKLLISLIGLFAIIIALTVYQRMYNFSNFYILIVSDIYIWFVCFLGWGGLNFGSTAGGFTTLISKYGVFILAVIATLGIIATKEEEYT